MNKNELPTGPEFLKIIWPTNTFVHQIEDVVRRHPIPYGELPDIIELDGTIPEAADKILEETFKDPLKRERAIIGIVDSEGKLIINTKEFVGNQESVSPTFTLKVGFLGGDKRYGFKEQPALIMHTHGVEDLPASPQDFSVLIDNPDKSGGVQVQMVLTKSTKMMFIRTLQTPEIDQDDEVRKIISNKEARYKAESLAEKLAGNVDHDAVWTMKNMKFVLDICREYKIGTYISIEGHRYSKINT